MSREKYDAVVVGAGPNGLSAAIRLQQAGLSVLLLEASHIPGGGARSAELTLPGFVHDICSAVHPLTVASPWLNSLALDRFGLEFVHAPVAAAHPLDDGDSVALYRDLETTARSLQEDSDQYQQLLRPFVEEWSALARDLLGPLRWPRHPALFARFGLRAMRSATSLAKRFHRPQTRALWAGMAAHSILPLSYTATSSFGLVLLSLGHAVGWPFPRGGAQRIADALVQLFTANGGSIVTDTEVRSLKDIPSARAVLFDLTPRQLVSIAGDELDRLGSRCSCPFYLGGLPVSGYDSSWRIF